MSMHTHCRIAVYDLAYNPTGLYDMIRLSFIVALPVQSIARFAVCQIFEFTMFNRWLIFDIINIVMSIIVQNLKMNVNSLPQSPSETLLWSAGVISLMTRQIDNKVLYLCNFNKRFEVWILWKCTNKLFLNRRDAVEEETLIEATQYSHITVRCVTTISITNLGVKQLCTGLYWVPSPRIRSGRVELLGEFL